MGAKVASIALIVCETSHVRLAADMGLLGALLVDQGEQKNTRMSARAESRRRHRRHRTDWWNDYLVDNATRQRNPSCDRHVKARSTSMGSIEFVSYLLSFTETM